MDTPVAAGHEVDDVLAKRVIRKIDRTLVPLLFITYMFNFMDKVILSSAAVFGLREDNVSFFVVPRTCPWNNLQTWSYADFETMSSIWRVSSTAG